MKNYRHAVLRRALASSSLLIYFSPIYRNKKKKKQNEAKKINDSILAQYFYKSHFSKNKLSSTTVVLNRRDLETFSQRIENVPENA